MFQIVFRAVVNAAGPWVDEVRRLEDPAAPPMARLSKGVHVIVERDQPWSAALTVPVERGRVAFAVPWQGMLLLERPRNADGNQELRALVRRQQRANVASTAQSKARQIFGAATEATSLNVRKRLLA